MKVLMFSSDPQALVGGSDAQKRLIEYAEVLGELHVVVRGGRARQPLTFGKSLVLYPASARFPFNLFDVWQKGKALCRRPDFDVITVQSPDELGLIAFLVGRRFRIPMQVQIHTDIMSPWYWRAGWKERARYYIARFLIPRADCLRVVSERIKRSIVTSHQSPVTRVTVLPIFTNTSKSTAAERSQIIDARFADSSFKMVAAGRFVDKEKNFSMLIEMMRDFVKICPDALLVLVGDGPDKSNYQLPVTSYRLERNVIIEPWRDDLPSFCKSFDLFLLPSNYEGWGRAIIQAMAAGLPVVMTDVGIAGEVMRNGENGVVVPVGDRDAFLAAVLELYKNPQKRKMLASAGQETVRNLSPKTKEEYLALYKQSFLACHLSDL